MSAFPIFFAAAITLSISVLPATAQTTAPASASMRGLSLRVMTFNIHHTAGTDGKCDVERIAAVIREQKPDLVAVQEVDVGTERVAGVDVTRELARLTSMHAEFGKAFDYRGGAYGQIILSRFPIANFKTHLLPGSPGREQRIAVSADITPGEGRPTIRFVGVHLDASGEEGDRLSQVHTLTELFAAPDAPHTIIAGDFNAGPGSATMLRLSKWLADAADGGELAPTSPAIEPKRKIDWILLRQPHPWTVKSSRVIDNSVASDHRPLVVDLEAR